VGEGQRVGESWKAECPLEPGDAVALHHLPVWDLAPQLRELRHSHPGRVAAAGDTPFGGQRAHRVHLSFLDPASFKKASSAFVASGFLSAPMLRVPDAFLWDLHALDALEAEEQFDEIGRRLGSDPFDDCPERLLHVLAEGDALDREAAQVHLHALVRLKHARAPATASSPRDWVLRRALRSGGPWAEQGPPCR